MRTLNYFISFGMSLENHILEDCKSGRCCSPFGFATEMDSEAISLAVGIGLFDVIFPAMFLIFIGCCFD